ncbi:group III truncated hemoglobin [Pelagibius sp.]|uniref:group III truncated hemoglobin n=1 Tax=Pelagibius sp. TaxID=1931238 RepID=UPI002616ED89|nr:group III truncated hemoglobin [Pelagibius sp.]
MTVETVGGAPRPLHPEIDEAMIERLVRHFYARIRRTPDLGPIFEAVVQDRWEPHLRIMMDFWSSVMLMSGRFKGQPMQRHQALRALRPEHFQTWLALFSSSANEICPPDIAALFVDRAERIARSLQLGMFGPPELSLARRKEAP